MPLRIFYDASCPSCTASANRWQSLCAKHGFVMRALQSDEARRRLALGPDELPDELKVETRRGQILGGVDGILYVARHIRWAWPLWLVGQVPGIHAMLVSRYRKIAATRHCRNGACAATQ